MLRCNINLNYYVHSIEENKMLDRIKLALLLAALTLTSFQAQAQGYTEGPGFLA